MANEYLIQNTTLTAIANAIREARGESGYTINTSIGMAGSLRQDEVTVAYTEFVDFGGSDYEGIRAGGKSADADFRYYDYVADNNGITTLVIYKIYPDYSLTEPDLEEPFFHVGRAEVDGVEYDKWRKIELHTQTFSWEANEKYYIYTNVVTVPPTDAIGPLDMPAKIASIASKTVEVSLEFNGSIGGIQVLYTGLGEDGKPVSMSIPMDHANHQARINVVQHTDMAIMSSADGYVFNYEQQGLINVYENGGVALICQVGEVESLISIILTEAEVSEDLSAELAAQDELIADIKTAVAGKAGGGGGAIETCNLIIHAGTNGGIGTECLIPFVDDSNSVQFLHGYEAIWSDLYFQVPKGSVFFLNYGFSIDNGASNIQSFDSFNNYNGMFHKITGDAEITITY